MIFADDIIKAVQARGSDARDLRDAAHEACHALEAGAERWDRESIHEAVMKMRRGESAASEITARAVEQIVCKEFGVDCGPVETWAFTAWLEATKSGVMFPSIEWLVNAIKKTMSSEHARDLATRIIRLADA